MTADAAQFRPMARAEMDRALDWAAAEGWNPGLDDAEAFYATDPGGVFAAQVAGEMVAAITLVRHSADLAFLGLYLCAPAWRGRGIGHGLWSHALAQAGSARVGLDGVAAQEPNYRREGFARHGATHRFEGVWTAAPDPAVRPVTPRDVPHLIACDAAANGFAKPAFLAWWLLDTVTRRTLVLEEAGAVAGFTTVRRCRTGSKVGPLVAQNMGVAERLLGACAAVAEDGTLVVDVPDAWPELMAWCQAQGLTSSFATARMYRGEAPMPGDWYATPATLELG